MAKLTFFERLFSIRINLKNWSIGYYYQLNCRDEENVKIFQEWFALKCGICRKFSTGCGERKCSFCGICPECNKELQEMYERESNVDDSK